MLEEKMKAKGVSEGELTAFGHKDNHNGKKDVFRALTDVRTIDDLRDDPFLRSLFEVLGNDGVNNWEKYFPGISEQQQRAAGQLMAAKMLGTLERNHYGSHTYVSLNDLYRDTFEQGE